MAIIRGHKKNKNINKVFRVSQEENDLIRYYSKRDRISEGEFIRKCMRFYLKEKRKSPLLGDK